MQRAVFLIGVLGKEARSENPAPLSPEDIQFLTELADDNDLEADIVFAVENIKCAGEEKKVRAANIKGERPRVVQKINEVGPDLTICFGRIAAASAFGKGSAVLDRFRWERHHSEDFGGGIYVCDSLQRAAVQPGVRKWIRMSVRYAAHGMSGTKFGEYTILTPETVPWCLPPKQFGPLVGFDLETYPGLDPWAKNSRIRMAMISDEEGKAYVVQATQDSKLPEWVLDLLMDPTIQKAGSNIAFDYKWLRRFGYDMVNYVDTSTAEHVIDCTDPFKGLKWLTLRYLPRLGDYARGNTNLLLSRGGKDRWDLIEDHEMYQYAGADAEASYVCAAKQSSILADSQPWHLMKDLYPVLSEIQERGMAVDKGVTLQLDTDMGAHLSKVRRSIQAILGPINPNSPKQMAQALVDFVPGIDLRERQWVKFLKEDDDDEDEDISTAKAILEREKYRHPVIALVLDWRKWSKLHGSFVKAMLDKHIVQHGGRHYVHAGYNTAIVETYRLSASRPNPQQMPRKPGPEDPQELNVKRQFVSRFPGGILLNADYAQMEMRVAADLSRDMALKQALNTEDVHITTAELMLRLEPGTVTKDSPERVAAKTIGFATMYGAGARTIGKQIGIHKDEAKELMQQYFRAYPHLRAYILRVHNEVKQTLDVTTPFGFRRQFNRPTYGNWNKWDGFRVQRQAFNTIIQSTAACIMYAALVDVDAALKAAGLQSVLIATVHDSMLIDCPPGELSRVMAIVKQRMSSPGTERYGVKVNVPLVVDLEVGNNWGEMEAVS